MQTIIGCREPILRENQCQPQAWRDSLMNLLTFLWPCNVQLQLVDSTNLVFRLHEDKRIFENGSRFPARRWNWVFFHKREICFPSSSILRNHMPQGRNETSFWNSHSQCWDMSHIQILQVILSVDGKVIPSSMHHKVVQSWQRNVQSFE